MEFIFLMQIVNPPFLLWFLHLAVLLVPSALEAPVLPVEQNQVISVSRNQRSTLLGHSQVRIVFIEHSMEKRQVDSCMSLATSFKKEPT